MSRNIGSRKSKEKYWREQVNSWRKSGQGQAEFSRQVGISERSLNYWKRKFERRQNVGESQAVVAVPIPRDDSPEHSPQPIIIHAWHDLRLEIPADFAPESEGEVMELGSRELKWLLDGLVFYKLRGIQI
ncbi:IS66 family insertion sequence element accessory protein TnpA [Maridesulfovibrio hydrothermalis]|uniref:Transposase n=1 Tax=Maridesulfovibrio hydrothermalis AM13 = DSM 14728 TaxID=1121451 RepID=L0R7S2_9BACT|nr:hypothetical protein [Maridesulfovibrio hydrothermalis]CCO22245.1 protein of unknown function [Maridesulfovibrio hydrothermalis AM13 = DSM 14728]